MTLADFIRERQHETYPEPITAGHRELTRSLLPKVCGHIPLGGCVLDVGCGQGPALEWFKENGYDALGITTNSDDLRACKDKGLWVSQADMHSLGNWEEYIPRDLIWARHVLEHSIAPFYVLHEFARILKPGGVLYVEVPAPDTACVHESNLNHYSVMGAQMWMSLIQRAGFAIMEAHKLPITTPAGQDYYFSFIAKKPCTTPT